AYGQALELADELGMRPLLARGYLGLGRVHLRTGQRAKAEDRLVAAMGLFREMDMQYWIDEAGAALKSLGSFFVVAHDNPEVFEFLEQKFAGDEQVRVVLDRRRGDRRRSGARTSSDKRKAERRRLTAVDNALRTRGLAIIPDDFGTDGRARGGDGAR